MQTVRAIFVGDEPTGRTRTPFRHAKCAERLSQWIDYLIDDDDYIIVNQSDTSIVEFYTLAALGVPFVALGVKASSVLKKLDLSHFKLPHPSGLNRQINNKARLTIALMHCRAYLSC